MRLIDADALYEKVQYDEELARNRVLDTESTLPYPNNLNPSYIRYVAQMDECTKLKFRIADAPTIEPERKKGKWIHDGFDIPHGVDWIHCSECGRREPNVLPAKTPYCPSCGAKMEEGDE